MRACECVRVFVTDKEYRGEAIESRESEVLAEVIVLLRWGAV